MAKQRNRRKRKLIRMDLQLKVVFITLFVASLVLLVNFQLTLAGLWSLSNQFLAETSPDVLLDELRTSTIQKFLVSVLLAVPLATSVGILYSFKFCGPIYRFKQYFQSLRTGRWDERCMLRKGDDLQDVCEAINGAVEVFRERIRKNHALLEDVRAFLDEVAITADGNAQRRLAAIREGIEEERETFRRRFGVSETSEEQPAEPRKEKAGAPPAPDGRVPEPESVEEKAVELEGQA